jgi:hypothetical protein
LKYSSICNSIFESWNCRKSMGPHIPC